MCAQGDPTTTNAKRPDMHSREWLWWPFKTKTIVALELGLGLPGCPM